MAGAPSGDPELRRPLEATGGTAGAALRALVVDDEAEVRALIREVLTLSGYTAFWGAAFWPRPAGLPAATASATRGPSATRPSTAGATVTPTGTPSSTTSGR